MQIEIKVSPCVPFPLPAHAIPYALEFRNVESVCWHDKQLLGEERLEEICMDRAIRFERTGFSVIVEIVRIARAPMCLATLLAAAPIVAR